MLKDRQVKIVYACVCFMDVAIQIIPADSTTDVKPGTRSTTENHHFTMFVKFRAQLALNRRETNIETLREITIDRFDLAEVFSTFRG